MTDTTYITTREYLDSALFDGVPVKVLAIYPKGSALYPEGNTKNTHLLGILTGIEVSKSDRTKFILSLDVNGTIQRQVQIVE